MKPEENINDYYSYLLEYKMKLLQRSEIVLDKFMTNSNDTDINYYTMLRLKQLIELYYQRFLKIFNKCTEQYLYSGRNIEFLEVLTTKINLEYLNFVYDTSEDRMKQYLDEYINSLEQDKNDDEQEVEQHV